MKYQTWSKVSWKTHLTSKTQMQEFKHRPANTSQKQYNSSAFVLSVSSQYTSKALLSVLNILI